MFATLLVSDEIIDSIWVTVVEEMGIRPKIAQRLECILDKFTQVGLRFVE